VGLALAVPIVVVIYVGLRAWWRWLNGADLVEKERQPRQPISPAGLVLGIAAGVVLGGWVLNALLIASN
jgi:hypothetical protein